MDRLRAVSVGHVSRGRGGHARERFARSLCRPLIRGRQRDLQFQAIRRIFIRASCSARPGILRVGHFSFFFRGGGGERAGGPCASAAKIRCANASNTTMWDFLLHLRRTGN